MPASDDFATELRGDVSETMFQKREQIMNGDRLADAAATVTASSWVATFLAPINAVAQLVLTLVGILSGLAATWYYFKKARGK
jgi:hypothetical protein